MPKVAVISYHKNLLQYPKDWIKAYKTSITGQTYDNFDIVEMDYGGGENRIFENSYYLTKEYPTFVHSMNHLLDFCFNAGYDYVANTNVDDVYSTQRLQLQLTRSTPDIGIISSNFALLENNLPTAVHRFHRLDVREELAHDHNIICHPCVMYSRSFMEKYRYIPEEIPYEDLKLWRRAIEDGVKFKIIDEVLCFHRVHNQSVTKSKNR